MFKLSQALDDAAATSYGQLILCKPWIGVGQAFVVLLFGYLVIVTILGH